MALRLVDWTRSFSGVFKCFQVLLCAQKRAGGAFLLPISAMIGHDIPPKPGELLFSRGWLLRGQHGGEVRRSYAWLVFAQKSMSNRQKRFMQESFHMRSMLVFMP